MTPDSPSVPPEKQAQQVLETTDTCTLATASADGRPEAATVRFVADDALDVYITTESMYQKYRNMSENPRVALVVDGDANLQLKGAATEVHGEAVDPIERRYVEKYGHSEYLTNEASVFFEIATDWARLLVDGRYPPTFEMVLGDGDADPHGTV
ncbi:MAG: pyridoxamine 5'-phosphate oxidase [halophilic archaeon J07HX64]|nr:MAG: pyridoxamine 5'-phosphate oxidase [halophilic archaeon J07HX64]